jgi:hypothetical protein
MQHRLRAALVPAMAIATAAFGVAQFMPGSAVAQPKRLDELSARRPAAASDLAALAPYGIAQGATESAAASAYARLATAQLGQWLAAIEAQQAQEAAAAASRSSSGSGGSSSGGAASGDFLECTKNRESRGDYGAVSSSGTYRGAYQFHQNTWDNTAENAGRSDLVGTDPAAASPTDQDAMAQSLYAWQGSAPWGGRC